MEIEYPTLTANVDFSDVDVGCVFKFYDHYYIKIHMNKKELALRLNDYGVCSLAPYDKVKPYPASKLIIEN